MNDDLIEKLLPTLPGWCTIEKGKRLAKLAADSRTKLCVELGVFGGRSLVSIAVGLARNGFGRVDGIDPYTVSASLEGSNDPTNDAWWAKVDYEDVFRQAKAALEENDLSKYARIVRVGSLNAADQYEDESVDLLHADSNHSEEVSVAEVYAWTRKIRLNGFWIADDSNWPTLRRAQELLEANGFARVETYGQTATASAWCIFRKVGVKIRGELVDSKRGREQVIGDYFGSVCCINLDRRPDRWAQAQAEFERCEIDRYTRIAAIDNRDGVAGCAASHRELWRQIATGDFGERVLVFEDDFQFLTREDLLGAGYLADSGPVQIFDSCAGTTLAERFAAILPYIPTRWDLLYLGGFYTSLANVRLNEHVIRSAGMFDLHAYGISHEYARRITMLLDSVMPRNRIGVPIDEVLDCQARCPEVIAYTLSPRLFIQRPGVLSDISRTIPSFPHARVDAAKELT